MVDKFVFVLALQGCLIAAANGLECYTCVSSTDLDCARKPGKQLEVEECDDGDECVTTIISGVTHRGCLSKVIPSKICSTLCEKCSSSLCNVNIYPSDRLRCYQCSGSECGDIQNNTAYKSLPCPIYKEVDRCYTNIISVNYVQRGCEATDLTTVFSCTNICLKCNYDACNNEIGVYKNYCTQCSHSSTSPNYKCLRCQEDSDDDCSVPEEKTCYNKVLHGHREKCFSYINEQTNVVNRGCSTAMGFFPTGSLVECYGENCNTKSFDIQCNVCNTTTNPSCRNQTSILRAEKCKSGTSSCFSCEDGTYLWRGCESELPLARTNQICYQCRGANGCNRQSIRSCYKCSSLEESNCASWMDISNITISNCTHPDEKCVSTLMSKFDTIYTLRGCASQVSECTEADPFCDRCEGSLCNYGPKQWDNGSSARKYLTWLQYNRVPRNSSGCLTINSWIIIYIAFLWLAYVTNNGSNLKYA